MLLRAASIGWRIPHEMHKNAMRLKSLLPRATAPVLSALRAGPWPVVGSLWRHLDTFAAVIVAAAYAFDVVWFGIPGFRHDWAWPTSQLGGADLIVASATGWRSEGIGAPYPYPSGYLVGLVTGLAVIVLGARPALWLFVLLIGAACTFGAVALSERFGAGLPARAAAALFALANPWVYTQTVAGHTYMILAYGMAMLLASELLRRNPRPAVLLLFALGTLPQLQYFLPVLVVLVVYALRSGEWRPALGAGFAFLPCAVGILGEQQDLSTTLYALAWQRDQSIAPAAGWMLAGYFTKYAEPLPAATWYGLCAIAAMAIAGAALGRRKAAYAAAVGSVVVLLTAAGTEGPLGSAYASVVEHVPASGLYRELYDIIGFVAIAYVALLASAAARFRILSAAYAVAAVSLVALWLVRPVWSFWVPLEHFPILWVPEAANVRFAATPAFGPLRYLGKGSGLDPDAIPSPHHVTPLMEPNRTYPTDAALARFELTGEVAWLRRLSVAFTFDRPYLRTDAGSLSEQVGMRPSAAPRRSSGTPTTLQDVTPELSVARTTAVGSIADRTGDGNIWFFDVTPAAQALIGGSAPAGTFVPVAASNAEVFLDRGWVDERLSMIVYPQFAHAVGGALTSSSGWLDVQPALDTLVDVRGTLRSQDGSIVSGTTSGPRWVRLDAQTHRLRCSGLCLVAAQGQVPNGLPQYPPPVPASAVPFTQLAPWLAIATLPNANDGARLLRYNVAYDRYWQALTISGPLAHLRLDATTNGWIVPAQGSMRVVLVHTVAALGAVIESAVLVWLLVWLGLFAWRARQRRSRSAS
jgi:hypothetical protein